MTSAPPQLLPILKNVQQWNASVLDQSIQEGNIALAMQSCVLYELYNSETQKNDVFLNFINQTPSISELKKRPLAFLEFSTLVKKYNPTRFNSEYIDLINSYETILKEVYLEDTENNQIVSMLILIANLKQSSFKAVQKSKLDLTANHFLTQNKATVETKLDTILRCSEFGNVAYNLSPATIEAIEAVMLDATNKYDLLLVCKALKALAYSDNGLTYSSKIALNFLSNNQSLEGYIGHYEEELITINAEDTATEKQLAITKDIVITLKEYYTGFRFFYDLADTRKATF